jgi:hypothetical protein
MCRTEAISEERAMLRGALNPLASKVKTSLRLQTAYETWFSLTRVVASHTLAPATTTYNPHPRQLAFP